MLINEEIYGNLASVYHRSRNKPEDIVKWLEKGEWKSGTGAGNMYGLGLYTVFTLSSNSKTYGSYLYKIHVKGIKNFFIFLPEIYNKVFGTNFDYDRIIAEQNKRFGINVKKYTDFVNSGSKLHSKCAGIIFHGDHDGDVCIIFEPKNAIFNKYSIDNGKTWKSIEMSKEYKSNALNKGGEIKSYISKFKDYIKNNEYGNFIPIKNNYKIKRLKGIKFKEISELLKKETRNWYIGFKEDTIPYFSCYLNNEFTGFLILDSESDAFTVSLINGMNDANDIDDVDKACFDFIDLSKHDNIKYNFLKLEELKNKISKEEYIKLSKAVEKGN